MDGPSSSTSPPTYLPTIPLVRPYPQPQHPSFRQRKSSTIISISPTSSDHSITPSTSPVPARSLPVLDDPPIIPSSSNLTRKSNASLRSEVSLPPSFRTVDSHGIPEHVREAQLERRVSNSSSAAEEGEATPLLAEQNGLDPEAKWYHGPLFVTGFKLSILFFIFTGVVVGTFWFGMPTLDPEDRGSIKIPTSFADLQALNSLFQKYKTLYPFRMLACGVVSYLFVQTFSLPGSMYISILFGAAYGMLKGLFLSCICEAVGSVFCYTLSALLAPPLLALPFYRARVETWRVKIMGDPKKGKQVTWDGVLAILIVLRIAPFPPHWVANFVAPHLGIGMGLFFCSVFIGIAPVSVIHVTIGSSLDTMTSADDFHLLSLRNVLGLCAVVVAVLIPVGLKRVFRKDIGDLGEAETALEEERIDAREVEVPALDVEEDGRPRIYQAIDSGVVLAGPSTGDPSLDDTGRNRKGKGRALAIVTNIEEDEFDVYDGRDHRRTSPEKLRQAKAYQPVKGYGAIEMQPERIDTPGTFWPFAR